MYKKTSLYVVRCNSNGTYRDSAPCQDCMVVIKNLNIKKIIYSCNNNNFKICKPTDYIPMHCSQGRNYLNKTNSNKQINK